MATPRIRGLVFCELAGASGEWKTAIWFDTRQGTYLLPVKASIRLAEDLQAGDARDVQISL
jgi:hypothetical protein